MTSPTIWTIWIDGRYTRGQIALAGNLGPFINLGRKQSASEEQNIKTKFGKRISLHHHSNKKSSREYICVHMFKNFWNGV